MVQRVVTGTAVAPLAGSVDRNEAAVEPFEALRVAPLAGSVDRNLHETLLLWC